MQDEGRDADGNGDEGQKWNDRSHWMALVEILHDGTDMDLDRYEM